MKSFLKDAFDRKFFLGVTRAAACMLAASATGALIRVARR